MQPIKEVRLVFKGDNVCEDYNGVKYPIVGNYVSKSKLLDGDELILRSDPAKGFFYKVTKPVKRITTQGVVLKDRTVRALNEKVYKVNLTAYKYYQLQEGTSVMIDIRTDGEGLYCAILGRIQ